MAQPLQDSLTIKVRVQPKASRDRVDGYQEGTLRIRVTAPPQDGKANEAVVSLLAKTLGIAKRRVRIVRGHGSREKLVTVDDLSAREFEQRLSDLGE